ncbi:MAG TPA: agmatine deiminase family protein, partial [Chitinophagaceae bacterium]|nr:agmatine deiminase family protein [Chitinophagaceae bacterium]
VWVGWDGYFPFVQPATDIIKALWKRVPVKVVVNSKYMLGPAKQTLFINGVDTATLKFYIIPDSRIWIRDHGATFLKNNNHELAVADFRWTFYGAKDWLALNIKDAAFLESTYKRYLKQTGKIDSLMGSIEKAANISSNLAMEGGTLEVNGKGTLILNEAVMLQRNPGLSKDSMEKECKRVLGVKKIIWLKKGLADDPHIYRKITGDYFGVGTGGHTDEFVRFANATTILLAWVDPEEINKHPINKINAERMKENLAILEKATDQDGQPFNIIKVPLPDPISKPVLIKNSLPQWDFDNLEKGWFDPKDKLKNGQKVKRVAAASYLNYLLTNDAILLPGYADKGSSPEKENKVKEIFEKLFPGRELIFINVLGLNYEGGGIHCVTQQQPIR